jgi:MFS transporter, ACS family, DAL5 transporter family protein
MSIQTDVPETKALHSLHDELVQQLDPAIERKIIRKLDFTLIPILWFLFLVAFVDRGNIANAVIQG